MQLSYLVNKIQLLHEEDVVGFDPKDVIFIANKWDHLFYEDDDEDEAVLIWKSLKSKIRNRCPNLKEKNIFRTALRYVITYLLRYIKSL